MSQDKGVNHIFFIQGIKFVLIKNERGYRGYFRVLNEDHSISFPLFVGTSLRQALTRLLYKAAHEGHLSIEDFNKLINMEWKTPLDIEVWSKMNKVVRLGNKHYFNGRFAPKTSSPEGEL